MCGIVGLCDLQGAREADRALLARMNESQHHRGPDETGTYFAPGVGLGHKRLSIIDLSSGQQPLFNEDRTVVTVFNGEIYNFRYLVPELEAAGHTFRTHSDTEVIVHAWETWGEACVDRFRGMFAFAIWDTEKRTLFVARDRLGVKPFYYAVLPDGWFAFGSELKSLMAHPALRREIDPFAVEEYFAYGYVPEPRTIYRHAHKLEPGHTLTVRAGEPLPAPRRYWDVSFARQAPISLEEASEECVRRIREAVEIRLVSEVPLGAFLSGGVDSSAVVATMAGLSGSPVNTCSIGFTEAAFDESAYAEAVAARYRTNHFSQRVDANDFDLIDRLAYFYDEPYADSSAIPTYRVCELARQRVTVALSGDGGDENFAGYRRYRWHLREEQVRGLLPQAVRGPLFGLLGELYPKADWAPKVLRAKSTFQALARDSVAGYFESVSIVGDTLRSRLFSPAFRRELGGYQAAEVLYRHARRCDSESPLARVQYLDLKTYLVGDILTKVDRASMAHSLEVREPLLDHPLTEWAATLPADIKVSGNEGKRVLKKAFEPALPHDLLYRPKMGFSIPLAQWFRGPLRPRVEQALASPLLADTGVFDRAFLQTMLLQHTQGVRDFSVPLWATLMYESFLRRTTGVAA